VGSRTRRRGFAFERAVAALAVREAGALVLKEFGRVAATRPVPTRPTVAIDHEADAVLARILLGAFPAYGWLSEESTPRRSDHSRLHWVVDPLDGTREFVLGIPEFAVSVALMRRGIPEVAALLNPVDGRLYDAIARRGSRRADKPIRVSAASSLPDARILASRSEVERGEWSRFGGSMRVTAMGSVAHKLAQVAAGEADATFTLVPKHSWDVAAGVLLVREAGGVVTAPDGGELVLDAPGHLLSGLVASNGRIHEQLLDAVATRDARTVWAPAESVV
jgi:myo-inositol-1(or 4)-monophosphatase